MLARLWLILMLVLTGVPRTSVVCADSGAAEPMPACCQPAQSPPHRSCCDVTTATCDARSPANAVCHRSGGPCRCGVRPDEPGEPTPIPATPVREGSVVPPAVMAELPQCRIATAPAALRRASIDARLIPRAHLETRARLGSWRT